MLHRSLAWYCVPTFPLSIACTLSDFSKRQSFNTERWFHSLENLCCWNSKGKKASIWRKQRKKIPSLKNVRKHHHVSYLKKDTQILTKLLFTLYYSPYELMQLHPLTKGWVFLCALKIIFRLLFFFSPNCTRTLQHYAQPKPIVGMIPLISA